MGIEPAIPAPTQPGARADFLRSREALARRLREGGVVEEADLPLLLADALLSRRTRAEQGYAWGPQRSRARNKPGPARHPAP